MEFTDKYSGLVERGLKIKQREAAGLRLLHDNFDSEWAQGAEPIGTLTFTDIHSSVTPIAARDLLSEIDALKARIESLEAK